jgi:hypothetical protein
MKNLTTKELVSLAGIVIVTPLLALGILVSARAVAMVGSDVSLLALALCGAVISGVTGFGRRTIKSEARPVVRKRSLITHS